MRIMMIGFLMIGLLSGVALGQDGEPVLNEPRLIEIFWAPYSQMKQGAGATAYGGDLSLAVQLTESVAIVADLSAHRAEISGFNVNIALYRFGPKFSLRGGERVTGFAHLLVGGYTASAPFSVNVSGPAIAMGGGVDIAVNRWFAVRAVQADHNFLRFQGDPSHGFRIGGGLVFRFGQF